MLWIYKIHQHFILMYKFFSCIFSSCAIRDTNLLFYSSQGFLTLLYSSSYFNENYIVIEVDVDKETLEK